MSVTDRQTDRQNRRLTTPLKTMFFQLPAVALLRGGGRTAPGDTFQGGDTRPKINFLWLNLGRTLDKRRVKMGVVMIRQSASIFLCPLTAIICCT